MTFSVVDLFSGGGGASAGFSANPAFSIVGAADAEIGKPSSGAGNLSCNATYRANIGIAPASVDLASVDPKDPAQAMGVTGPIDVLIACPPCTGFSRTLSVNHRRDDPRNGLVGRTAEFVRHFHPKILVMENARELVIGRFSSHLADLTRELNRLGYEVASSTYLLDRFGLPQRRERAIVIAARRGIPVRTLNDLWSDKEVDPKATHVRRAIWDLPRIDAGETSSVDRMHRSPSMSRDVAQKRMRLTPHDGGSWRDLATVANGKTLMIPSMQKRLEVGDLGSHPDIYGRMWWDRPAPTIKRECGHVGNGRYAHPEQDRLCSVREMGILNGFPDDYVFLGGLSNMYRHIGDAVPPLISYQLAAACQWSLSGESPATRDLVMPRTSLQEGDIRQKGVV